MKNCPPSEKTQGTTFNRKTERSSKEELCERKSKRGGGENKEKERGEKTVLTIGPRGGHFYGRRGVREKGVVE